MGIGNEVIGHATCIDCGARVERRINKARKVYWFCDGAADDQTCNAGFKHGGAKSRRLIAEAAKLKVTNDNQKQENTENDRDNEKSEISGRQSEKKSNRSGGFGLFGG